MWRYSALKGGGGGSPTPVFASHTFSPTNFGLSSVVPITTGTVNNFTADPGTSLGTTTAALDGLFLNIMASGKAGALHLFFGSTKVCTGVPYNGTGNNTRIDLPIAIPANTNIGLALSTTASSQVYNVCPIGYQRSLASDITSISGLGPFTTMNNQGASIAAVSGYNQWTQIGALAADAKGIAHVHAYIGGDTSRTPDATNPMLIDIGIGGAGSETVLIPNMSFNNGITNSLVGFDYGPFRMALPTGTRLSARAKFANGTLPEGVNVQLAMMY